MRPAGWGRAQLVEHGKKPESCLMELLRAWDLARVAGVAVTGRLSRTPNMPRGPTKRAIALGLPERSEAAVAVAQPAIRTELFGEAVMTVGGPLHEWRREQIDAALCLGPFECMPSKIAEAQHFHTAEREGLLALTLTLNGDPVDPEVFDNFVFEVRGRFEARKQPDETNGF